MSDAHGEAGARRGNFASRKARGETGGNGSGAAGKSKEHGYDARKYHQNANVRGIHALRTFDCPVCESKNTIRVTLNPRARQGTVWCTYCSSLRPVPEDLPYPSVQRYVPSLENKADVFFRFNEQYTALLRLHNDDVDYNNKTNDSRSSGGATAVGALGTSSSLTAEKPASRKRPGEDDMGSQAAAQRPRWETPGGGNGGSGDDGLFGCIDLHADTGLLDDALLYSDGASGVDEDGAEDVAVSNHDVADVTEKDQVMDSAAVDDVVEVADFFADSD